jgi:flagellar hook protein FlgE
MGFGTGLSGLNAASKNLDVIGHNIANANTTGMKAGRAEFSEMYASALGAAGGSNGGIGVAVAAIAQQFTQGNIKVTGGTMDMAINGEGFFKTTLTDGSTAYTRNGEFKLNSDGYIITNNGAKLQGYPTDTAGVRAGVTTGDLKLPTGATVAPKVTTDIVATANLDSRAPVSSTAIPAAGSGPVAPATHALTAEQRKYGTSINVYDSLGNAIPVQMYFIKDPVVPNTWQVRASVDGGKNLLAMSAGTSVTFNSVDNLLAVPPTYAGQPNAASVPAQFTIPVDTIALGIPSATLTDVKMSYGDATKGWTLTQYGSDFSVFDLNQDGYAAGELTNISISEAGVLTANYSNGESFGAGQVALTRFRNPQGLAAVNGGYWQASASSGDPIDGAALEGRFGQIRAGALEESNVDLTAELVNMIVAQRSYQANAQTIKTQDQVMTTLVNIR